MDARPLTSSYVRQPPMTARQKTLVEAVENSSRSCHVQHLLPDGYEVEREITEQLENKDEFGFGPNEHSRAWVVRGPGGESVVKRLGSTSTGANWYVEADR